MLFYAVLFCFSCGLCVGGQKRLNSSSLLQLAPRTCCFYNSHVLLLVFVAQTALLRAALHRVHAASFKTDAAAQLDPPISSVCTDQQGATRLRPDGSVKNGLNIGASRSPARSTKSIVWLCAAPCLSGLTSDFYIPPVRCRFGAGRWLRTRGCFTSGDGVSE